jgi:hypothetical protein
LNLRAANQGGAFLTLFNASDEPRVAIISSGLVRINKANRCDLLGRPLEILPVQNGALEIKITPRQTITLALE